MSDNNPRAYWRAQHPAYAAYTLPDERLEETRMAADGMKVEWIITSTPMRDAFSLWTPDEAGRSFRRVGKGDSPLTVRAKWAAKNPGCAGA